MAEEVATPETVDAVEVKEVVVQVTEEKQTTIHPGVNLDAIVDVENFKPGTYALANGFTITHN